uniref:CNNM transmembrane domain-containing protein n=1 Tax=Setaria viridis TaxID=4556 RepID=A0A4U6UPB0_SETVI|nr:hypothetical protein SEVIR_5G286033v2 [Setaria viridis]
MKGKEMAVIFFCLISEIALLVLSRHPRVVAGILSTESPVGSLQVH